MKMYKLLAKPFRFMSKITIYGAMVWIIVGLIASTIFAPVGLPILAAGIISLVFVTKVTEFFDGIASKIEGLDPDLNIGQGAQPEHK